MNTAQLTRAAIAELTGPGGAYELTSIETSRGQQLVFRHAPSHLGEIYAAAVSDAPFIVYGDERLTFGEVSRATTSLACCLVHDYGIAHGDRVAISMRNYPEWMIAFNAITSIGAVAVAMNSMWATHDMAYVLSDSGARLLFADEERVGQLERLSAGPDIAVIAVRLKESRSKVRPWTECLAAYVEAPAPVVNALPDDLASILYTSGSTGRPKGVPNTHRRIITSLLSWELDGAVHQRCGDSSSAVTPAGPSETAQQAAALLAVPLFHVTGAHSIYLGSYRAQRKVVCMHKWDPDHATRLIEAEHVTSFVATPAMTGDLLRAAATNGRDLSSLRAIGGGGAPRAAEQVRQLDVTFHNASPTTGWGMTETTGLGTVIAGDDYLERPASAGQCSAVMELRVVDDEGHSLRSGEHGEVLVRGTTLFEGYWNNADATAASFVADGWFRTGDVGYLDGDGWLFIVDRLKDLIIRGGENVSCGHVESAMLAYPGVYEAAVYAVPDDRLGEDVGATIYCESGLDLDQLVRFLRDHLASFEVPRHVRLAHNPLPRTPSGKILKRELRDEAGRELS